VTDRDQTIIFSLNGDNSEPERFSTYEDFPPAENRPVDLTPGLISLGFLKAAIVRSMRFWLALALVGLLMGVAVYEATPHKYQATATLLLTHGPYEDAQSAAANNQAIGETRAVAGLALRDLKLQQTVSSFLSTYTVAPVTDRVLNITASASSQTQAVTRANAVASAFLAFRANEMQTEQSLVTKSLNQQVNAAKQHLTSLNAQISQLPASGANSSTESQLSKLETEQTAAKDTLGNLQQAVTGNQTSTLPGVISAVKGSTILSVAPVVHSRLKALVLYAAFGVFGGLFIGLAIVVLRALVSDRLRLRDDIADAIDAPVKLSVGMLRKGRLLPSLSGRSARRTRDMHRVVTHLQAAVPGGTPGPVGLAVVSVENGPVAARAVADLATSYASQNRRVVVADLSKGAPLARLLGVKRPGIHEVSRDGGSFTVAVPERDDAAPGGPLRPAGAPAGPDATDTLVGPGVAADVVLTLVTLDPALGGDHLATWASRAVVMVSAGQSSSARLHGVGEMVRLAGTRLDSVVLIGADKGDESLGLMPRPEELAALGPSGQVSKRA
jgi:capsular polysaccharide biosynthesis protein